MRAGVSRGRSRVLAVVSLVFLAGCGPVAAPGGPFAEVWPELREQADSLFAAGQPEAAAQRLHTADAVLRAPWAPSWQRRELDLALADARRWPGRRPGERDSLHLAAASVRAARRASQHDSLDAAERLAASAYATRLALLGRDSPVTATAALELADLSFRLSRIARTDSLASEAMQVLEQAYGPRHPELALAHELLGRSLKNYHGAAALPRALGFYQEALRMRVETVGPHAGAIASAFHEIGNLERSRREPVAALAAFRVALALRREQAGPVHDEVASTLTAMAILEGALSHFTAAESLAAAALRASPAGPATPPMSRAFRVGVWGQLLRLSGEPERALAPLREAIHLSEQAWALTPRDEGSTIQSGISVRTDLALALAGLGRSEEALAVLERGTSRTLLERSGADAWLDSTDWLARVQRSIAPDEALVSWVRSRFSVLGADDPAWAVVVRDHGEPQWIRLPATTHPMRDGRPLRDVFWIELRNTANWPVRLPGPAREQRLAREMERAWFDPLLPALAGVRRLVVFSPDLCAGGPIEAFGDDREGWLIDRYAVSYASSATLQAWARERSRGWPRAAPVLVVGDPAYAQEGRPAWARLAGSRDEAAAVEAAFPATRIETGARATAGMLRELAASGDLARYRMLHIAAHTTVDVARLFESRLVLAPAHAGEEASFVSAREIGTQWRLDADLVCLTGCRSGTGMSGAAQGWLGFQYAFMRAGARSVLVSLWPVDDAAAALLVREFYAALGAGPRAAQALLGSRAEALAHAKRAVRDWRDAEGQRPYAHPAYWAGFALMGEPGETREPAGTQAPDASAPARLVRLPR